MLPETFPKLELTVPRLTALQNDLTAIGSGPDKTRSLAIALTHIETALLWVQRDIAERLAAPAPPAPPEGAG